MGIMDIDEDDNLISHPIVRCIGCKDEFCAFFGDVMEGSLSADFLSNPQNELRRDCNLRNQIREYEDKREYNE